MLHGVSFATSQESNAYIDTVLGTYAVQHTFVAQVAHILITFPLT